jgi:hypothetical protein
MHCVAITKINLLLQFREVIIIYSEKHMEPVITPCGQNAEFLNVKAGGVATRLWSGQPSSDSWQGEDWLWGPPSQR